MRNTFVSGSWNAICDRCAFKFKANDLRDEWTGRKVCAECWEPRHPQDLIRVPKEEISPPWARPEVDDTFINVPYITPPP